MTDSIFKNNIDKMRAITSKMPKTLNEAINFNESNDVNDIDDINMLDEPMDTEIPSPEREMPSERLVSQENQNDLGANELLSNIRKMAINGLAKLADNPDDPNYEMLKKIFLMLDKAVTEKQEQREVMAKNPNANQI